VANIGFRSVAGEVDLGCSSNVLERTLGELSSDQASRQISVYQMERSLFQF